MEADQVLRWGLGPGDTLLIIDGLFLQSRAVRHKELLCLLDQGVRLYGASSMGALRAAELEAFGMQGIGRVFEDYRDGLLVGDDEVALTHGDADSGYQCASWALVDLRYAAQQAARAGVIDHEIAEAIVCVAKKLPFTLRDNFTILTQMREHGYHNAALVNFRVFCTLQRPSIKLTDAHAALRLVACATHPPKACAPTPPHPHRPHT
ncbi:hypothetical protein KJK32_44870 [Streptomyces sp. JCM17656]|nr:hypothetical protein KJK32_44870 [Streptomyces sp. JCM17656]